jgi:mRNA interferase MazF
MDVVNFRRFEVYLVSLDPAIGAEIQKTRPCVIISPDVMNRNIQTVIVAPMTTANRSYPSRIHTVFQGKKGQIVLDQIRTIDKRRLVKRLGSLPEGSQKNVLSTLNDMFAP